MKYKVKKAANLLDTVMDMYHGVSRQKAKQIISNATFQKNGKPLVNHPKEMLEPGDFVEVIDTEKKEKKVKIPKRSQPFAIYFEDDHLLVALKPAGILSVADSSHPTEKSYHKALELFLTIRNDEKTRLWVVQRLDRELEGLMLFAKSERVQQLMTTQWPQVTIKLLALTEGRPALDSCEVANWLRESSLRTLVASAKEMPNSNFGKTAIKYVREEGSYHVLEIQVIEGRNKQIRLHLSDLGCPIVGDRKYGASGSVKRQIRLAANVMELTHPITGRLLQLSYQPPQTFYMPLGNANEQYKVL